MIFLIWMIFQLVCHPLTAQKCCGTGTVNFVSLVLNILQLPSNFVIVLWR
jgi:hypothetical protein